MSRSRRARRRGSRSPRRLLPVRRRQPDEVLAPAPRGRSRQLTSDWGPSVDLGSRVQIRARRGVRAAAMPLQPGVWVVTEVPDNAEFGVAPLLLTPLLVHAVQQYLKQGGQLPGMPRPPQRHVQTSVVQREPGPELGCSGTCSCGRSR